MKIQSIKFAGVIMFVTIAIFTINSCKKNNTAEQKTEAPDYKAKAIQATIERYGRISAPVIFQPRQTASSISYKDAAGNVILYDGAQNRTDAACGQYTCSTTSDPNDLYVTYTLKYIKWYYTCWASSTDEHDLTAIWKVSVPYSLLLQSGSNYSYGNIRILSGGSVVLTSGNLGQGNMSITNLGADPNCSANTLYEVRYTWFDVADTYFPDNSLEASFTIYNDCSITNNNTIVSYTFGATYTNQNDVFTHPCDRTDQAWVNPNTGPNNMATILGAYNICTPPSGFTGTANHQVEYRAVTHSTSLFWDDQTSNVYWGSTTGSSYSPVATMNSQTGILFLNYMLPNSGDWLVRYRNRHTSCAPTINVTNENWNNSSGNNNYMTEYWPL
jgi:hypothetical protein